MFSFGRRVNVKESLGLESHYWGLRVRGDKGGVSWAVGLMVSGWFCSLGVGC